MELKMTKKMRYDRKGSNEGRKGAKRCSSLRGAEATDSHAPPHLQMTLRRSPDHPDQMVSKSWRGATKTMTVAGTSCSVLAFRARVSRK